MAGSPVQKVYLLGYNTLLCLAWGYVLWLTVRIGILDKGSTADVYKAVELPLKWAQTAAVLEVVNSALGVVKSPVFVTAIQVASRLWILWGIVVLVPVPTTTSSLLLLSVPVPPAASAALPPAMRDALLTNGGAALELQLSLVTLLVAWGASEVIRYSFYAFKEALGYVPYPSTWLRYTGFIVLYPLGVSSELAMVYLAWPTLRRRNYLALELPNKLNFSFSYQAVCLAACASYLPGLPTLYGYMLTQRKRQLGGARAPRAKVPGKEA